MSYSKLNIFWALPDSQTAVIFSRLMSSILQSQERILKALNLTKAKLDQQELENNLTKSDLEQLKLNFTNILKKTAPIICQKNGSKYRWIKGANRCIYYDASVSTYSTARTRCHEAFHGNGQMYEPKTFEESIHVYKFGLNTYWRVNAFLILTLLQNLPV